MDIFGPYYNTNTCIVWKMATDWPGTCTYAVNGASKIDGTVSCGALSVSAGAGAGLAVGSDYGINTALVEAVLLE